MVVCFGCKLYLQAHANVSLLKTSHKTMNLTEVARQQSSRQGTGNGRLNAMSCTFNNLNSLEEDISIQQRSSTQCVT